VAAPIGNKYAVGNTGGRPPMFTSVDDLMEKVTAYFDYIQGEFHEEPYDVQDEETGDIETKFTKVWDRYPERPTITGLSLFLGFADKQSMYDYKKKEEFSYPIKRALSVIENNYEMMLDSKTPTGAIFALKNMDWKDKIEQEITKVKTKVSFKDEPGS